MILHVVFFDICNYSEQDDETQLKWVGILENGIQDSTQWENDLPIVEGGDSFAVGFIQARAAVEFATDLAKFISGRDNTLKIRTGIYTGEVTIRLTINKVKNMYGRGIDSAARIAGCCLPGQILVSEHTFKDVGPIKNNLNKFLFPAGTYKVKHDHEVKLYNLFSSTEGIGVEKPPLKRRVNDSALMIIVGDRREKSPKTVGDLFVEAPSIDDLCHIFKFDWPNDVVLRGDKIMCWARQSGTLALESRNLFVIGSPKVNIGALMMNSSSIFRFKLETREDIERILSIQKQFHDKRPNDEDFLNWYQENETGLPSRYPWGFAGLKIEDPMHPNRLFSNGREDSYAFISFAAHPFRKNGANQYAIIIAGADLCGTLTLTREFFKLDFSQHLFGGVVSINKLTRSGQPWYDDPHHGRLLPSNGGWVTPGYDTEQILLKLDEAQQSVARNLLTMKIDMQSIQELLRKS